MEVNSAAAASVGALVNSLQPQQQAQPAAPKSDDQPQQQQDSTVVKLSDRAKELNRTENQNNNNNTERAEPEPKEAAEPPGIQFMAGETKGGRVDTFA